MTKLSNVLKGNNGDLGWNFICMSLQCVGSGQDLENIAKSYSKTHVLDNPDIDLGDPEAVLEDPDPPDPTR